MSFFNFQKIVSASSSFFNYASKATSMFKSITPTIKDIKSTVDTYKSIKSTAKDAHFKEIESTNRPASVFKKKIDNNRSNFIDSLTLFYKKKN